MTKVLVNRCYGGFGLSEAAYLWLIDHGIPLKAYIEPVRDPVTKLYAREPHDRCIYDRALTPNNTLNEAMTRLTGRYWDTWSRGERADPLLVQCVEELGSEVASGRCGSIEVVEIPDGVDWVIEEYDGNEHIAERHRTW